jgi:hypothetical protein
MTRDSCPGGLTSAISGIFASVLPQKTQLQEESIPRGMQMRVGAGGGEAMVL